MSGNEAFEAGKTAYLEGAERSPLLSGFSDRVKDEPQRITLMMHWLKGWDTEMLNDADFILSSR